MGYRLVLLVPKLPVDLEQPTGPAMRKALMDVVAAIGGAVIETSVTVDEDFDGLYDVIRSLPSEQPDFGYRGIAYDADNKPVHTTIRCDKYGAPLAMVEAQLLGLALGQPQAGRTWRNRAAERFFSALPPRLPVFLMWE